MTGIPRYGLTQNKPRAQGGWEVKRIRKLSLKRLANLMWLLEVLTITQYSYGKTYCCRTQSTERERRNVLCETAENKRSTSHI